MAIRTTARPGTVVSVPTMAATTAVTSMNLHLEVFSYEYSTNFHKTQASVALGG